MRNWDPSLRYKPVPGRACPKCGEVIDTFGWCDTCYRNRRIYGHEKSSGVPLKAITPELIEARRLIAINSDHAGVKAGIDFFRNWIANSRINPTLYPCGKYIGCLDDSPEQLAEYLAVVAACYIRFRKEIEHRWYDGQSAYTCAVNILVKKAGFVYYRMLKHHRFDAVIYIMRTIGRLIEGFWLAYKTEADRKTKAAEAFETPLSISGG